jgi:hypothetical protein
MPCIGLNLKTQIRYKNQTIFILTPHCFFLKNKETAKTEKH